MVGLYF